MLPGEGLRGVDVIGRRKHRRGLVELQRGDQHVDVAANLAGGRPDRVSEFRRRVDVGSAAAGQDSCVAFARGEHPQAVPHAAAPGQPGHPGAHRLRGDPELLQVAAELTCRLGQPTAGAGVPSRPATDASTSSDSVRKNVWASPRIFALVLTGNTNRGGDPDDRTDGSLLDPQQQQAVGEFAEQAVHQRQHGADPEGHQAVGDLHEIEGAEQTYEDHHQRGGGVAGDQRGDQHAAGHAEHGAEQSLPALVEGFGPRVGTGENHECGDRRPIPVRR